MMTSNPLLRTMPVTLDSRIFWIFTYLQLMSCPFISQKEPIASPFAMLSEWRRWNTFMSMWKYFFLFLTKWKLILGCEGMWYIQEWLNRLTSSLYFVSSDCNGSEHLSYELTFHDIWSLSTIRWNVHTLFLLHYTHWPHKSSLVLAILRPP